MRILCGAVIRHPERTKGLRPRPESCGWRKPKSDRIIFWEACCDKNERCDADSYPITFPSSGEQSGGLDTVLCSSGLIPTLVCGLAGVLDPAAGARNAKEGPEEARARGPAGRYSPGWERGWETTSIVHTPLAPPPHHWVSPFREVDCNRSPHPKSASQLIP